MSEKGALKILDIRSSGFGGEVVMQYDPTKSLVDLTQFFIERFYNRDKFLGTFPNQERSTTNPDGTTNYEFSMFELEEAFMADYTPEQMASFLEKLLDGGTASKRFLEELLQIESEINVAIAAAICFGQSYNSLTRIYCTPINHSIQELNNKIRTSVDRKDIDSTRHKNMKVYLKTPRQDVDWENSDASISIIKRTWYGEHPTEIHNARNSMLSSEPRTLLLPKDNGHLPNLNDYFDFIKTYKLPTNHLKITRK